MKLTSSKWLWNWNSCGVRRLVAFVLSAWLLYFIWPTRAKAEVGTTTVQGIVYLANGQPGSGMLHVSWPGFTTANGRAVVADSADVMIGQDGFLTLNLAPNQGAMPGGLFYTAVFYMDDGSTSTQYRRRGATELFRVLGCTIPQSAIRSLKQRCGRELSGSMGMHMFNEFEAQVLSDLSVLKTQMNGLVGDGNGGRCAELEKQVECHERNWQRAKGFAAAGSVLYAAIEVALDNWFRR